MKFGLSQNDYDFLAKQLKEKLPPDSNVFCYGSRARGDYQKFSDIDLMVESNQDCSHAIIELKETFEESRLPIKVDIVDLKNFASAYLPSYHRDKVDF